jgi:hypothetical protein
MLTMPLLEHQMALGRCLCASGVDPSTSLAALRQEGFDRAELAELSDLVHSPGFRFTRRGQRSWCEGRTAEMAQLTLSILSNEQRRQLVNDWVDAGGGVAFDPTCEAERFLEFVASHLNDPSHAMALCRMEQAVYRASEAALRFRRPDPSRLNDPDAVVCASKGATVVRFFAEPQRLFAALEAKAPLPPLSDRCFLVLFAPGLSTLCRAANNEEAAIWEQLAHPTAVRLLSGDFFTRPAIEALFRIGAVELVPDEPLGPPKPKPFDTSQTDIDLSGAPRLKRSQQKAWVRSVVTGQLSEPVTCFTHNSRDSGYL